MSQPPIQMQGLNLAREIAAAQAKVVEAQAQVALAASLAAEAAVSAQAAEDLIVSDLGTTDGQTRALIEAPGSQTAQALSASTALVVDEAVTDPEGVAARRFGNRVPSVFYDDFTTQTDGPIAGRAPVLGPAWSTTGDTPPYVQSGFLTSSGTGYAYATYDDIPDLAWADVAFDGAAVDKPMTIAFCLAPGATMLDNMVHLNWGPLGFSLTVRRDGELTFPEILAGAWSEPLPTDGVTTGRVALSIRGNIATVHGPNGQARSVRDNRIGQLAGRTVFWEPRAVGSSHAYIAYAQAAALEDSGMEAGLARLSDVVSFLTNNHGAVAGSRGTQAEVTIGIDPTSKMPTIFFGAERIVTHLTAAAEAGATSLQTDQPIPPGSVLTIESGNAVEVVTTGAYSTGNASPYTTPINTAAATGPLTKAHPARSYVGAVVPASARVKMVLNVANGQVSLPDVPVLIAPGGKLYLGSALDTFMERNVNGFLGANRQALAKGYGRTTAAPKTADYTAVFNTDDVIVSNGATTITLPSPFTAPEGATFTVKNINSASVTVVSTGGGSPTIDGAASKTLAQWQSATFVNFRTRLSATPSGGMWVST